MENFASIVASLWIITLIISFIGLLITIVDADCEKRDVVRALGLFIVATVTVTALICALLT